MSIVQIITGPPRSGKARHVIDSILPYIKENRCAEILVLVPSNIKAEEIREFLLSRKGVAGFLGLRILTFLDLTLSTFQESSLPGRVNTPLARRWMVQNLLEKLPLKHLINVRDTRGLSDLSVDFIRTLKEGGISPDKFQEKRSNTETSPKLFEMGKIFQAYEDDRKKRNLLDREDLFTLAADNLGKTNNGPFSRIRKIVVTGFYDFTPLQLKLLSSLSELKSMEKTILTLLHQEGRGPGQRFTQRTLDRIRHVFPEAEITSPDNAKEMIDNPLKHLSSHFLSEGGEVHEIPCNESVEIIHAPGNYREVEEIARRIRHLVHHKTHTFKEISVVFRSINNYRDKVREVFRFYKIPHRMAAGFPLRTNPLVQAVTGILEVPRSDYQREAVCRLLRSDYFKFEFLEQRTVSAERFDTLAREAMIHGRKEEWTRRFTGRIKNLQSRLQSLEDGNVEGRDLDLREQRLKEYRQKIENYTECEAIIEALIETLSAIPKRAPIRTFVETLNELVRTLDVEKEIYTSKDLRLIRRDQTALKKFQELLNQMMADHETIEYKREIPLSEFVRFLNLTLAEASYSPDPPGEDAVLVTDALGTRELHRPVVFVGGLVEESFPRTQAPNPIFGDRERARLNRDLAPDRWIAESSHWREEEEILFLLSAGTATERLFLTYPRTDTQGRDLLPSRYIERVRSLFSEGTLLETEVSLKDPLPDRNHVFRNKDLLELTFRSLYRPVSEGADTPLLFNHLLQNQNKKVRSLLHGLQVIEARKNGTDSYTGKLGFDAAAMIRKDEAPYSATALETYGTCPFQYFCERELKVRPVEEVEDEINVMDMGSLYHKILERFYKKMGGAVTQENLSKAKDRMHKIIGKLLSQHESKGVPGHNKLWEIRKEEVHETLDRFLDTEKEEYKETREVPAHFEVSFGMEPLPVSDPLSTREPFTLESETAPIRFKGKIDRIDISEKDGRDLYSIVDYKTGKNAPKTSGIINGESLQVPLYADWVSKAFSNKREMNRGSFYLLRSGEKKCQIPTKNESWEELREISRKHIQNYVESIRKGEFPVTEKKCPDYCRYGSVCRIKEE